MLYIAWFVEGENNYFHESVVIHENYTFNK